MQHGSPFPIWKAEVHLLSKDQPHDRAALLCAIKKRCKLVKMLTIDLWNFK